GAAFGDEQVAQAPALIGHVLERVILQIDVMPCSTDGGEDRVERPLAVLEQLRLVAGSERRARYDLFDRQMPLQHPVLALALSRRNQQPVTLRNGQWPVSPENRRPWGRRRGCRGDVFIGVRNRCTAGRRGYHQC